MRHKKGGRLRATNRQAVIITLIACMLTGIFIGAIAGVTFAGTGYAQLHEGLTGYLRSFKGGLEYPMDVFRESALKYGKLFVFIWLLAFLPSGGFLPLGGFIATLLIIFRGAAYGFSTAVLVRSYEAPGAVCAAILYLPQSLLLVPAYIFTAYSCVRYIQKTGEIRGYLPVLAIGIAVSLLAGFIDAFIVPGLVHGLL